MSRPGEYYQRFSVNHMVLALILIGLPIAAIAVLGRSEWLLNWPVMFAAGIVLMGMLRGPLEQASSFLRKIVKIAASFCLLIAFTKLLYWHPFWAMVGAPGMDVGRGRAWLMVISVLGWWISVFWILFSRPRMRPTVTGSYESKSMPPGPIEGRSHAPSCLHRITRTSIQTRPWPTSGPASRTTSACTSRSTTTRARTCASPAPDAA